MGQHGDVHNGGVVVQALGVDQLLPVRIVVQHSGPFVLVVLEPL